MNLQPLLLVEDNEDDAFFMQMRDKLGVLLGGTPGVSAPPAAAAQQQQQQ